MNFGTGNFLEAREQHYQRFFGELTHKIMHSTDIQPVHIDIYQFEPTPERDFWTLITGGMSDERQISPEDCDSDMAPRAEIIMYAAEPQNWMFSVMKGLAEMPFTDETYLHWWHTVPNGMPMTATPSLLTSFFFLPAYFENEEFNSLRLDGDGVDFLWMIPITEAERAFAIEQGSDALDGVLREKMHSHVIDESRESYV